MKLGLSSKLASVRCIEARFLSLFEDLEATLTVMLAAGRKGIEEDGAQVLIPYCFGMVGLAERKRRGLNSHRRKLFLRENREKRPPL